MKVTEQRYETDIDMDCGKPDEAMVSVYLTVRVRIDGTELRRYDTAYEMAHALVLSMMERHGRKA